MTRPLVTAEWLAQHLHDPDLRVIDFRWYLADRNGRESYAAGHIPGAVFVDLEEVTGETGPGRHPLPTAEQFAAAMRKAGVSTSTFVVAYDDASGTVAARLWWMLLHFGHERATVLDGGLQAWPGDLATDDVRVPPGDFVARPPLDAGVVDVDEVRSRPSRTVLLDVRLGERYRGEVEPVDPRAGHIPGALSAVWKGNVDGEGRFLPPERLRERFAELGVDSGDRVIAYCGSGVNACQTLLALEVAGLRGGRLYAGSWSDWSRRPELPAATGPEP